MIYLLIVLLFPPLIEDLKEKQIRNIYPIIIILAKIVFLIFTKDKESIINSFVSAILAFVILGFCILISKEGIGFGDIKLLISIAFYLETELFLRGLLYISLCSLLFSLFVLATKKAKLKSQIPFVPFIFGGMLITTLMEALF